MKKKTFIPLLILSLLLSMLPFSAMAEVGGTITKAMPKPYYRDLVGQWYEQDAALFGYPAIFATDATFQGDLAMTRMEFVRALHEALGININYFAAIDIHEFFEDVDNETPGASQLYDLVISGIIEPTGQFYPEDALNREEMVHLIIKALDFRTGGQYALIMMMPAPFADHAEIDEAYTNDVMKAQLLNLLKGRGDNFLFPKASATRGEGVTMISRLINLLQNLQQEFQIHAEMKEETDGLAMRLILQNNTEQEIFLQHTSGQKFDFKLLDREGEILYTWSADKSFTMALTQTVVAPHETVVFEQLLASEAYALLKDRTFELRAYLVGSSDVYEIISEGYSAYLLP